MNVTTSRLIVNHFLVATTHATRIHYYNYYVFKINEEARAPL